MQPVVVPEQVQTASEKPISFRHQWCLCWTLVLTLCRHLKFDPFPWQVLERNWASAVSPLGYCEIELPKPWISWVEVAFSMSSPQSQPPCYLGLCYLVRGSQQFCSQRVLFAFLVLPVFQKELLLCCKSVFHGIAVKWSWSCCQVIICFTKLCCMPRCLTIVTWAQVAFVVATSRHRVCAALSLQEVTNLANDQEPETNGDNRLLVDKITLVDRILKLVNHLRPESSWRHRELNLTENLGYEISRDSTGLQIFRMTPTTNPLKFIEILCVMHPVVSNRKVHVTSSRTHETPGRSEAFLINWLTVALDWYALNWRLRRSGAQAHPSWSPPVISCHSNLS